MEKMKMQTTDIANENFLKLASLFPNAVTETIDENGEVVRAIDKDILMQEISTRGLRAMKNGINSPGPINGRRCGWLLRRSQRLCVRAVRSRSILIPPKTFTLRGTTLMY